MDLYTATTASNKLSSFLSELSGSDRTFYATSKQRLNQIRSSCNAASELISCMLQDKDCGVFTNYDLSDVANNARKICIFMKSVVDADVEISSEFLNSLLSIATDCAEVVSMVSKLTNKSFYDDRLSVIETKLDAVLSIHQPDANCSDQEPVKESSNANLYNQSESDVITQQDRKNAIKAYKFTFDALLNHDYEVAGTKECVNWLSEWFHIRFMKKDANFRYNIKDIQKWVLYSVAYFGYASTNGLLEESKYELKKWLIDCEQNGSKYVLPYCIYRFNKISSASMLTRQAMKIWDELLEYEFYSLCYTSPAALYPDPGEMFNWIRKYNEPELQGYDDIG